MLSLFVSFSLVVAVSGAIQDFLIPDYRVAIRKVKLWVKQIVVHAIKQAYRLMNKI
jgi:hypothetical protein